MERLSRKIGCGLYESVDSTDEYFDSTDESFDSADEYFDSTYEHRTSFRP
jgi:hypothetical protein